MGITNLVTVDISGLQTTAGAAEETVDVSLNGAAPAASIAVLDGQKLQITDILASARAEAVFQIQIDRGSGFVTSLTSIIGASGNSGTVDLGTPLTVVGGAAVFLRVRVTTPAGAALVAISMLGISGNP